LSLFKLTITQTSKSYILTKKQIKIKIFEVSLEVYLTLKNNHVIPSISLLIIIRKMLTNVSKTLIKKIKTADEIIYLWT